MAGDWIKMRADLRDDPAVLRMAEALGIDELHVVGCLFCFWAWADKHAVDGRVDGATTRLVDKVSMASGFADALVSVGWLKFDESGLQIPNFERHNGESAKERGLKNARQARWRAKKDTCVDGEASTSASTSAPTREEKRREEITPTTDVVGESALKPRPARKCPEGFEVTPAMQDWATINAPLVNLDQATATFRDHTFKTAIADWAGAWRNWMRREQQYTTDRQRPGARPAVNRQEAIEQRNRAVGDEWLRQQEALDASQ